MKNSIEIGAVLGLAMMTLTCSADATFLLAGDSTLDDYGRKPRGPYASWGTTLEKVGKDESMKFFVISTGYVKGKDGEPSKDVTHPVAAGAEAFAKLFIDDVKARKLAVAALFQ